LSVLFFELRKFKSSPSWRWTYFLFNPANFLKFSYSILTLAVRDTSGHLGIAMLLLFPIFRFLILTPLFSVGTLCFLLRVTSTSHLALPEP